MLRLRGKSCRMSPKECACIAMWARLSQTRPCAHQQRGCKLSRTPRHRGSLRGAHEVEGGGCQRRNPCEPSELGATRRGVCPRRGVCCGQSHFASLDGLLRGTLLERGSRLRHQTLWRPSAVFHTGGASPQRPATSLRSPRHPKPLLQPQMHPSCSSQEEFPSGGNQFRQHSSCPWRRDKLTRFSSPAFELGLFGAVLTSAATCCSRAPPLHVRVRHPLCETVWTHRQHDETTAPVLQLVTGKGSRGSTTAQKTPSRP